MKALVDIDGTLCKFKWFGKILLRLYPLNRFGAIQSNNRWKRFISYISSWFYDWIRIPDKKIIKEIRNLAQKGHTIYIFSAVPDIKRQRKAIEKWLRESRVPFKGIFLMKNNETPIEFKIRVIKEVKPEVVYENNPFLINEIFKFFPEIIIRCP